MIKSPHRVVALTAAVLAAAGLAACSSSSSTTPSSTTTTGNVGTPVSGGTLKIVAASGPSHIDTVPSYYTVNYQLEHAYTRQMLSYPAEPYNSFTSPGWLATTTPAPDIATQVPTTANGGITNGGKTITFHIKQGVDWNTSPARQVVANDFIREFKAFFNPVSPVSNPPYYLSTIAGLTAYSNEETAYFANKANKPTAANIANFQNTHTISGLSAPDPMTLQITLIQPTADFLYMMAMPFTSPRPVEYDAYVPDSLALDQHTISVGPYQISSYVPGKSITLVRNPAWSRSTDSLRHNYVAQIVDTFGVTSAETQLSDFQAGTEDLMDSGTFLNPASVPGLVASHPSNFAVWPWSSTFPYTVFNLRSPDSGGAVQKLLVRQAIEYGIDKVAVQKANGGPEVGQVINTVIPPGNTGYVNYNLYPDNAGQGNVAMCKSDLAKAGYPNGLTLTYMYPNDSTNVRIYTAIQASLANCGVTLTGKEEPGSSFFTDLGNSPENNKSGAWDLGQPGWIPDWFGNNGRTIIQALFQGPNCVINTVNYGCYENATVNSLITQAEGASTASAAGNFWHQADMQIMSDAAIVPMLSIDFAQYSSARVRGIGSDGQTFRTAIFQPNLGAPDVTALWLAS